MRGRCLFLLLLMGCADAAPPCVALSPQHATRDGVIEVGVVDAGDTIAEAVDWVATPVWGVDGDATFTVEWRSEPQDTESNGPCRFMIGCSPNDLVPSDGEHLTCGFTNDVIFDACTYRTIVTVIVTAFDTDICSDALEQVEVTVQHDP
jgi:hypothetical protein